MNGSCGSLASGGTSGVNGTGNSGHRAYSSQIEGNGSSGSMTMPLSSVIAGCFAYRPELGRNATSRATSVNTAIVFTPLPRRACENRSMKTVAVVGASSNRAKFGNKALRAFEKQGYTVFAINPNETQVEGHKTYASVLDVPGPIDMATIYVPPEIGVRVMDDLVQKGIREVWLNPGADDEQVVTRARAVGLTPIIACSIIGIGDSPARY
jgi:predicted CoA-binding protein